MARCEQGWADDRARASFEQGRARLEPVGVTSLTTLARSTCLTVAWSAVAAALFATFLLDLDSLSASTVFLASRKVAVWTGLKECDESSTCA